ncbi:hypothetical protein GCM10007989_31800 [Devosia pacifica]|uniref:Uncharacterized protein n=1 Tax=Devosia pacifica TaxID=1335967 RepID=A0A918SCI4_9HYPH|nr:hypothetical protein [Devosia pacifica]GHA33255.1 hypothetical protein GCM10007989_31800 [Devosia pacifica]
MTFKYSVTLPVSGGDKLRRFREWAGEHVPALSYSLPVQTVGKTQAVTIELRSLVDRKQLLEAFSKSARI